MPNWCYSTLEMTIKSSDLKNLERVKENGGICATYAPMPEELKEGQSPVKIVTKKEYEAQKIFNAEISDDEEWRKKKGITQKMHDELVEKHGCADWYTWQNRHWGVKWGDRIREIEHKDIGNGLCVVTMRWETPWGPFHFEILEDFINHFRVTGVEDVPNTTFEWEEEQGYGAMYEWGSGLLECTKTWDLPEWGDVEYEGSKSGAFFVELKEDYENGFDTYPKGFYEMYNLNDPYDPEVDGDLVKSNKLPF